VDTIKRQTWAVYGCLVIGQSLWAQALRRSNYSVHYVALC